MCPFRSHPLACPAFNCTVCPPSPLTVFKFKKLFDLTPVQLHSEVAALKASGIPYEICPGVSSALAAPLAAGKHEVLHTAALFLLGSGIDGSWQRACCNGCVSVRPYSAMRCTHVRLAHMCFNQCGFAGFPLTHPDLSRAFAVTSAHDPAAMDWPALAVGLAAAQDVLSMLCCAFLLVNHFQMIVGPTRHPSNFQYMMCHLVWWCVPAGNGHPRAAHGWQKPGGGGSSAAATGPCS